MQHHSGSWYIPWGLPLQKMLTLPMHPGATATGYLPQPQATAAVQAQGINNQNYQHQIHPAALAALHQSFHPSAAAAAAAAMFTPISLRAFLNTPQQNHLNLGQQALTAASIQQQNTAQLSPNQTQLLQTQTQHQLTAAMNHMNGCGVGIVPMVRQNQVLSNASSSRLLSVKKILSDKDKTKLILTTKRKAEDGEQIKDLKKAKLETKALKAKRPGFTDDRYHETSYYIENGLRKVYPYYFTFTTFTKGRWVGEKILDVFAREFRAHPAEEYERCIDAGTLTVNYDKVPTDYKLKHNDLLANVVHRHEVPVTSQPITIVHMDDDIVVVNKPASIPVHPCGRYRHNTVVFILAKEYNLKNLRTIHRLDRLTSGLLLFGRNPKKARQMEHQIRNRQVQKEYVCRVDGEFPDGIVECKEPIEVVSYKIGVCKVSSKGKECTTNFEKLGYNGKTSIVLCKPLTGRMHQIRVHLQYLGYPVVNDPLYNHEVFGPEKGKNGDIGGKTDEQLIKDLIGIHNAENWLGIDGDSELSLFNPVKNDSDLVSKGNVLSDDDSESVSREASPCSDSPRPASSGSESPLDNNCSGITITTPPCVSSVATNTYHHINTCSNTFYKQPYTKTTVSTQTGNESPNLAFSLEKMTLDKHCYECKVRYRDPKPQDLVMYLHAWKYKGPGWEYETELPDWATDNWTESDLD